MSAAPLTFYDRFRQWPRALQWAMLAGIGFGLFMLWDTVLSDYTNRVARAADALETQASEIRQAGTVAHDLQMMGEAVQGIGQVELPKATKDGAADLQETVNTVLKKHGISNFGFDLRPKGKLPPGTVMTDKRLDRLTGDLKFSASPEESTAIIAELESSPIIASVNSVRIVKYASRKVKVNLTLESWVVSSDTGKATH